MMKSWKQPKCPSIKWMNKKWFILWQMVNWVTNSSPPCLYSLPMWCHQQPWGSWTSVPLLLESGLNVWLPLDGTLAIWNKQRLERCMRQLIRNQSEWLEQRNCASDLFKPVWVWLESQQQTTIYSYLQNHRAVWKNEGNICILV